MDERRTATGSRSTSAASASALPDAALEALAYGPETPVETATAARTELLRRRAGREARHTPAPPAAVPGPSSATTQAPDTTAPRGPTRRTSRGGTSGGETIRGGTSGGGTSVPPAPDATGRGTGTHAPDAAPALQTGTPTPTPDVGRSTGRAGSRRGAWRRGPSRLPGRPWFRGRGVRTWVLVLGTAVVAGALGAVGTVAVGRLGPAVVQDGSSDSGSETLTRVLARGQTAEDRLPSTMQVPVDRSSARLLFANYADRPPVPWAVWIARARSGGDVCFIASPDRYATDITCLPSRQALGGHVSYTTRDGSQGLSVRVDGGVARIDLIGGE